jgi:hypothetical protein
MSKKLIISLIIIFILGVAVLFFLNFYHHSGDDNGLSTKHFSVLKTTSYVNETLKQLVIRGGGRGDNNLCVVGYENSNNNFAEVYWKEKNMIYFWWEPDISYTTESEDNLIASRIMDLNQKPVDLKQDLVDNAQEIGSSTFLVTKAWANDVLNDCQKFGDKILIAI